jgi:HD superfamily phosphohydrolase
MWNYNDFLYGTWPIPDGTARIIETATFQRLRRISQSGASKYAHSFKTVTRFEHSVGVYLLLHQLGAKEQEQVAGLLHDISHTAFSHVIDIVYYSAEQDFHEQIKDEFLSRTDLESALSELGYSKHDLSDEESFSLLEQPLPALCADRIDYSLRDAVTVGLIPASTAQDILADMAVVEGRIVMRTRTVATEYRNLFQEMNDRYWANQEENYLYELLAQAIEIGLEQDILSRDDLLTDDMVVEAKLRSAGLPEIEKRFAKLLAPPITEVQAFVPSRPIKQRAIDPDILFRGKVTPLSQLDGLP